MIRLDKYLADLGAGTRSEIKKNIRKNGVQIGGELIRDPGFLIDEKRFSGGLEAAGVTEETGGAEGTADRPADAGLTVIYQGENWTYEPVAWYMMNKPAGVLSASEDRKQKTVVDLIREGRSFSKNAPGNPNALYTDATELENSGKNANVDAAGKECREHVRTDLFPVGRLDKDTEGLLLITNDGQAAHRLLAPKFHVDKTYFVRADGTPFTARDVKAFADGIPFDEHLTALPARLEILGPHEARVTIREGKFHQIKKMIAALGGEKSVVYLRRESFGPLILDPKLAPGEFRRLTGEELAALRKVTGKE